MSLILEDLSYPSVAILSLNRPDKRNALNIELMEELCQAIAKTDPRKRALILKGEGPVFCAGLDLVEAADPDKSKQSAESLAKLLKVLSNTSLITIALITGAAVAGGAGLMAACDYIIAEPKALFGFPEVRRGLVAAQILPFLKRQLKDRDLRELLLLGELINAKKAQEVGLINVIVEKEHFLPEALRIVQLITAGAPGALAMTKELLDLSGLTETIVYEIHRKARDSVEAQEGIAAFLEHRPPSW